VLHNFNDIEPSLLPKEIEVIKSFSLLAPIKSFSTSHILFTVNIGLNPTTQLKSTAIKLAYLK